MTEWKAGECRRHYPPRSPGHHPPVVYGCFACKLEAMGPPLGVTYHVDKDTGRVVVIDPRVR